MDVHQQNTLVMIGSSGALLLAYYLGASKTIITTLGIVAIWVVSEFMLSTAKVDIAVSPVK